MLIIILMQIVTWKALLIALGIGVAGTLCLLKAIYGHWLGPTDGFW